jgi:outer membrane protein assembly factor BamB
MVRTNGHRRSTHSSFFLAALVAGSAALADDWPQFMGPRGDGISAEKNLLQAWPAGGPKVLWRIPLGPGYGGAAVRGGEVFVLDRVDEQKDVLRCLDLETGRELWSFAYDAPGRISHDGSRSTPAVTETHVYAVGPFGQFHCLDRRTRQVVWKKNLLTDYGARKPRWAVAQSPVLYQDTVVVAPQSDTVGLAAFDQVTGAERWHSGPIGAMAYVTPKLVTVGEVDQFVALSTGGVAGVSARDGEVLWRYAHYCKIPIPNVTDLGEGRLLVTGGYKAGSAMIQLARGGGAWQVEEVARIEEIGGHCHPGLVYRNHVYLLCNINERRDGFVCFDADGKLLWQTKRDPDLDKGGSILTGDGLIYIMDGAKGELHIVKPSPAGFESLDKAKLLEGREIWGPLALANGRLLIRDQSQMKCVSLLP